MFTRDRFFDTSKAHHISVELSTQRYATQRIVRELPRNREQELNRATIDYLDHVEQLLRRWEEEDHQ